jgi:hypothetical protein
MVKKVLFVFVVMALMVSPYRLSYYPDRQATYFLLSTSHA